MAAFKAKPPIGDRTQIHGKAEKRQQMIRRHIAGFALQRRQFNRFQPGAITLQAMQLIGDGHFHLSPGGSGFQLRGRFRRGTEFWAPMHHHNLGRDILE